MNFNYHLDKETLARVIQAIPSNIFFKDTELKYVFCSHIWEQVDKNGDEEFDIYGKSDWDIRRDTENLANVDKTDHQILETGEGRQYTIKSEIDGHVQYLDIIKEPVRDADGNIIGIVGLLNDVTRVTQEISNRLENEKAYQEAMRAGALLAYNTNLSQDILYDDLIENIDGKVINLLNIIGLKAPCSYSEMVKKYAETMLDESCREEYITFHNPQNLIKLYNDGEREIARESRLIIYDVNGNKMEMWYYETILLMQNTQKEIRAFFTINDITESRKKEQEIRRQLEENVKEAERVANMKSDFLANMSHEIRTPMNAVIGMAEMALREDLPPAARDYISQIKSSGNVLLSIINDILDFSKIDSGKMDILVDEYELATMMRDVYSMLQTRVGDKNMELICEVDPSMPSGLMGDAFRIRQIIINLANNAIKFTREGSVKIVTGYEKVSDDEIVLKIEVKDTGIGIRQEDISKLFNSFQQLDSKRNRNIEGTGLGLAITSKLLELMDGTIDVESEYGAGSTFTVTIPQKVTNWEKSDVNNVALQQAYKFDFVAPDAKILIVDDNDVNLLVAEGLLEPLKVQVTTATSGPKALECIEKEQFDIVFMDHMMPGMDGVETTKKIKELYPEYADMPIIALSANATVEAKKMFLKEGMDDFVAKPIEVGVITSVIYKWLPKEKIKATESLDTNEGAADAPLQIGDLDVETAVAMVGSQKTYLTILEKYCNSIKAKAQTIKSAEQTGDINLYTIEVHALKSSSKQIGAMELSEMAAELEACGKAADIDTIHAKTDALLDRYLGYVDVLEPLFKLDVVSDEDKPVASDEIVADLFEKMYEAADNLDMDAMEKAADQMAQYRYEGELAEMVASLREAASNVDVDIIEDVIEKWKQ